HERRCRRPCKTRFRLADCAFTGRGSNPLDDFERFQVLHSILLSRACPDASWVHAERLLQKLMPATTKEERSLTMARDLVWRFYKALKAYKQNPSPQSAPAFRLRFDRIFTLRTGYEELDKLLERLHRRKNELLKVLDHPGIPLHTNASENALRTFVTKRKISGGTMSRNGRVAGDTMLVMIEADERCNCLTNWHCHRICPTYPAPRTDISQLPHR
ncbi:IS66 family transposase, partial [Rhizobium sp. RAF56]|uniref:IS66 family transposase n=1 Tax=Rhizobium sp. RAF56 TaxID=3233062 RepID=UPI003F9D82CA